MVVRPASEKRNRLYETGWSTLPPMKNEVEHRAVFGFWFSGMKHETAIGPYWHSKTWPSDHRYILRDRAFEIAAMNIDIFVSQNQTRCVFRGIAISILSNTFDL
jgi:hypothetical protein